MFKSEFIKCAFLIMAIILLLSYKIQATNNPNGIVPFWSMVGKLSKSTTPNSTAQFNPTVIGDLKVTNDGAGHGGTISADNIVGVDTLTLNFLNAVLGISTNAVTSDHIIADSIIANYLTTILGISTNALTADHTLIGYETITHGLGVDEVTANTVNVGQLNSTNITNTQTINTATLEVVFVNGSTIECDLLNVDEVTANTVNVGFLSSTTISNTGDATTDKTYIGKQIATPDKPLTGYSKLYTKADGKWYTLTAGTNETLVGPSIETSEVFLEGTQGVQVKGNTIVGRNIGVSRSGNTIYLDAPQGGGGGFDPTQDFINIDEYLALREISEDQVTTPSTGEIKIFMDISTKNPAFKNWLGVSYIFNYSLLGIRSNYLMHFDSDLTNSGSYTAGTWTSSGGCAVSSTQKKFGAKSLYFDDSDDFVYTSNVADFNMGSGDFTIDCWFRLTDVGVTSTIFAPQTDLNGFGVYISNSNKLLYFASSNGSSWNLSTGDNASGQGSHTLSNNTWYHFAWVRNGSSWKGYLNGKLDNSQTISGTIYTNTGYYAIGRWGGGVHLFGGYIDEFRVVKGTAVWTSDFTPPTAPYAR